MRAYHRLGLTLHPAVMARASRVTCAAPGDVREGGPDDLPFTAEVDRHVRGAAHGDDILTQLAMGQSLLIAPGRGYAVHGNGTCGCWPRSSPTARATSCAPCWLARAEGEAFVNFGTTTQQSAIDVCMEAKLDLHGHGRRLPRR